MTTSALHDSSTADGTKLAIWKLRGGAAIILRFAVEGERTDCGPVAPDLTEARELFPAHDDLWDVVRVDRMAVVCGPGAALKLTAGG